ncbi:MAG: hypothetical protein LIP01_02375 [Tannerellaceae bacterium]|nr:hypothetical protein [Tannerellaceae bacterium]
MAPYTIIPGGGSYPAPNGIRMSIGKAFAKVSVAYIPEITNGTLENVEYRIINDPKHMYLVPNKFKGQVHTPHYDKPVEPGKFNEYFDEYFNENSHIKKTFPDSINFSWRPATVDKEKNKAFAYCMENGNKTPLQGNSTMVLVKAKYKPAQWLNPDDSVGNETLDGTFWRIRNTTTGTYSSGYYTAEPIVGSTQEAIVYPEGITYYPIWLETNNKYTVERNHYYKIAITEVLSAGAPDLDSVMSPESPLEYPSTETRTAVSGTNLPEVAKCIGWKQKN